MYFGSNKTRFYKSGVLKSCCDREEDPGCDDMSEDVTHAITVYGYKVQKNKNGRTIGHWKIQNSWGEGWGYNGLMKVDLFGDNDGVCNINRYGVFSVDPDLTTFTDPRLH